MSDFWSRRRAAVAAEEKAQEAAIAAAEDARFDAELSEQTDEELLAAAEMPEPEALETPEQVREFMSKALPQRLKTRALRQMWKMNPVLANLDGLVDYGEDFTDSAMVVENLQTAYQVGKGMLAHIEALAAKAEAEAEAETRAPEDLSDEVDDGGAEDAPIAEIELADLSQAAEQPTAQTAYDQATEATPEATPETSPERAPVGRRRMIFTFEQASA